MTPGLKLVINIMWVRKSSQKLPKINLEAAQELNVWSVTLKLSDCLKLLFLLLKAKINIENLSWKKTILQNANCMLDMKWNNNVFGQKDFKHTKIFQTIQKYYIATKDH